MIRGGFFKKKKQEPKKLEMKLNPNNNFAEFRCPYCNALVYKEYYATARVPVMDCCPECKKELGHY